MRKKKSISALINKNTRSSWADYADASLTPKYILNRYDDKKATGSTTSATVRR